MLKKALAYLGVRPNLNWRAVIYRDLRSSRCGADEPFVSEISTSLLISLCCHNA